MIQKVILAMCLILGSHMAVAQEEKYQEGVHYFKLDQAQPSTGVVEVTEIFSYACSHCNTFEPYVQNWKKSIPENVKFNRIPVVFGNRSWEMMARGYIAADMMGIVEESHVAMMDAIWKQRQQFRSLDQLADFYSGFGVEKKAFLANYQSFAADSQLRRVERDTQIFGVTGTPSIIVNRKYRVPNSTFVWEVVDYLVAKETAAAGT